MTPRERMLTALRNQQPDRVPMPLREWETSVRIRLVATGAIIQMQVNGMYEFARPLKAKALKAEAFAAGGTAVIRAFDVYAYDPADFDKKK